MRRVWRRFRAKTPRKPVDIPQAVLATGSIFDKVRARLDQLPAQRKSWRQNQDVTCLNDLISEARHTAEVSDSSAEQWLYALTLQAPRAAEAQRQMDKHPHGYHDKDARLNQLIDFNDTFDSTVLALVEADRKVFDDKAKQLLDWFCKRMGVRCFSNEQWEAIARGLSREIALYIAAIEAGYDVRMTSRAEDAFGIDMVIHDRQQNHSVNIDCKTRSAFYFRIKDLVHEGRLSEYDRDLADQEGHTMVVNGRGDAQKPIVLMRIMPEELGDIQYYRFVNSGAIRAQLAVIMERYGT